MRKISDREAQMLGCVSCLPRKMIALHHVENVPEFVLHDLCHENCFNLNKAVYLIDNPDFNCCKGIAGFSHTQSYSTTEDIWQEPDAFSLFMRSCPFNQKVRDFHMHSIYRNGMSEDELVQRVAKELAFNSPHYVTWNMKHDNHGLLVYEVAKGNQDELEHHLSNSVYLFSFCPVF